MKVYKVGIIGCGRISRVHLEIIAASPGFCLAALCDIDPAALAQARARYAVPGFADYQEMFTAISLDLVVVLTPSGTHPEQAAAAIVAGLDVLVEKPIGVELAAIDRLLETLQASDRKLFEVKQNRYNPPLIKLKQAVAVGRLGRPHLAHVNLFWSRPQDYFDLSPWRGDPLLDGGVFMNQAVHFIDALLWLFGPVRRVAAEVDTLGRKIESEDTGGVVLKFVSGLIATMAVTVLAAPCNLEGSLTVLGSLGTVRVGGVALNQLELWHLPGEPEVGPGDLSTGSDVYGEGHRALYGALYRSLSGQEEPAPNGSWGRDTVEVVWAIKQAAATGRTITLPVQKAAL